MKLKFKVQKYQSDAVDATVDCFAGQPYTAGTPYRIDPGRFQPLLDEPGFRNAPIMLNEQQLLANIIAVQQRQQIPHSTTLTRTVACPINLDIEMETGTGKTYVYIKTMFDVL
jgi:type III restriction enzyme